MTTIFVVPIVRLIPNISLPQPRFIHVPLSMKRLRIFIFALILYLYVVKSDEEQVKNTLLEFISKLSNINGVPEPSLGWNTLSYPCRDQWRGVTCDKNQPLVNEILLSGLNLSGVLDFGLLCNMQYLSDSLLIIDVTDNHIQGENYEDIVNCSQLTHLLLSQNSFTGNLPTSISQLKQLKVLDVSHNRFSGAIPISNFSNFTHFDVSYNNLIGAIPGGARQFPVNGFVHNPELCGPPLPNECVSEITKVGPDETTQPKPEKVHSTDQILMFTGYALIGLSVLIIITVCVCRSGKMKEEKIDSVNKVVSVDDSSNIKPSFSTIEMKTSEYSKTPDFSVTSAEHSMVSSSLIVLTSPEEDGPIRFEDLLKAPAELLGKGKHGSVYKVRARGTFLVVKRIKDWTIPSNEFKQRMRRLDLVKHPYVLPAIAFYSSKQEKLLVYEYQQNGSLLRHIHSHGNQTTLDWSSRISAAATIAEALAFMHEELQYDKIPHGNLKSSNILLNKNMEPCISEYGLMIEDNFDNEKHSNSQNTLFKADIYAFGVILLELLTGRMVLNEGLDLASWVVAVVREEWTVEVFDKNLIHEGASEESLVKMLQIAVKCVNKSPEARPDMSQVALMVNGIKEDDERSMDVSGLSLSMTRSFIDM